MRVTLRTVLYFAMKGVAWELGHNSGNPHAEYTQIEYLEIEREFQEWVKRARGAYANKTKEDLLP